MMNQELTMRQRPQIKAFYVLLRYVITLLLDGTDKTQLVSALSVDEAHEYCITNFKQTQESQLN